MKTKTLELDTFIDPALGAAVSVHSISWRDSGDPEASPSDGNQHFHHFSTTGTRPHSHEFCEIVFVLNGKVIHCVNGEEQHLREGDALFIRPDDIHFFKPEKKAPPCEIMLLSFQLEFFATISHYLEDDGFLHSYTESVVPPIFSISEPKLRELSNVLQSIADTALPLSYRKIRLKVILAQLLTEYFLPFSGTSDEEFPFWLQQLCEKMNEPENFIVGLRRMQLLSGYTPEHLCKIFRKYLRQTPTAFINERKINHAAQLLTDTDLSIAEVTYAVNIQSLSRFYHLFQQQFSCTPIQYRKRMQMARKLI